MASLRLPTVQHFATYCGGTVPEIAKKIAKPSGGGSGVSYETLRTKWIFDCIQLGISVSQIEQAIQASLRGDNIKHNIGALRALETYLNARRFSGAIRVESRLYPIGRGLYVPVNPPFVLTDKERPRLFWPSFWKTPGRLVGIPGSVFISILEREMFNRPDFKKLDLDFLDLSCPSGSGARSSRVYNRKDFNCLSDVELARELEKFIEAYFLVKQPQPERTGTETAQIGLEGLPLFTGK